MRIEPMRRYSLRRPRRLLAGNRRSSVVENPRLATIAQLLEEARELRRMGRLAEAERSVRQALAIDPAHGDAYFQLGTIHDALGRLDAAEAAYTEVTRLLPRSVDGHNGLAMALMKRNNMPAAAAALRRVLELRPTDATAELNLALVLDQLGKLDEAIAHARRGVELMPNLAEAHVNLGMLLDKQQRLPEAVACYRQALELKPGLAAGYYNLGLVLYKQNDAAAAVAHFRRAIELQPNHVEAQSCLASLLDHQGQLDEAAEFYRRVIAAQPGARAAQRRFALLLAKQGKLDDAAAWCRQSLVLEPGDAAGHDALGFILAKQGRLDDAAACFRRAIELNPKFAVAHNHLGAILDKQSRFEEATPCFQAATQLQPDFAEAHSNLGLAMLRLGRIDQAIANFRNAQAIDPALVGAHSNMLLVLQYRPDITPAELLAEHRVFDERHARPLASQWRPHANSPDEHRPLRIGFVSGDLGVHPVGYFLVRALENLDAGQVESICYSDRVTSDALTKRLRSAAHSWRDVALVDDARLAEQIRADAVDVLVDLAGHTSVNRLLVFARKPAPVQMTWLGYVGTTGLTAIDYLLADRHEVPVEAEAFVAERVLRLPDGYVCYDPPAYAPEVSSLPALAAGHVTFGSFSNPAKINADVVAAWSAILARVDGSRLLLKYVGLENPSGRARVNELFAANGIDPQRVELAGWSAHLDTLTEYGRVDIALDPFPYNGGLTTCEALWMGVPVVTCPGPTFAGRHSLSHLSNVGLTETIAADVGQYVELAVGLAGDLDRLATLRAGLRQRVASSPLCDGPRFAENLTALLRAAWLQWCKPQQK